MKVSPAVIKGIDRLNSKELFDEYKILRKQLEATKRRIKHCEVEWLRTKNGFVWEERHRNATHAKNLLEQCIDNLSARRLKKLREENPNARIC